MVEQAFYASARSGQRDGYQVAAASAGATPEDLRELSVWCPSHDGLLDASGGTPSLNAFPLPSGARCVARSFASAPEYSGRGGVHVVTHALLLSAEDYRRFANNPFAVMQAAVAAGHAPSRMPQDRKLPSFRLVGRARPFDRNAVRQAVTKYSLAGFVLALDACLDDNTTVIALQSGASQLLSALLSCLPVSLRGQISLASGLVYSPRRPYQWLTHHQGATELRRLERNANIRVVRMVEADRPSPKPLASEPGHAWTACVESCLAGGEYAVLERRVRDSTPVKSVVELDDSCTDNLSKGGTSLPSQADLLHS